MRKTRFRIDIEIISSMNPEILKIADKATNNMQSWKMDALLTSSQVDLEIMCGQKIGENSLE